MIIGKTKYKEGDKSMRYISKEKAELLILERHEEIPKLFDSPKPKILCPFHQDKQPSMQLYRNHKSSYFYCFGCRRRYTVAETYYKYKTGKEAQTTEQILDAYNMVLQALGYNYNVGTISEDVYELNIRTAINAIYKILLTRELSQPAIDFLRSKGFNASDLPYKYYISEMKSTNGFKTFVNKLSQKFKVSIEELYKIMSPVRPNRLIYSILDENSNIIAFASRSLDGSEPKYVNSGTHTLYSKSSVFYGAHIASAQPNATQATDLIIVEGYNDAIAMWEHGYLNTVALGGIALTDKMIKRAKGWGYKSITLMLDHDNAGIKSMLDSLKIISKNKMPVKIRLLEKETDIDEMFMKYGKDAFNRTKVINPIRILYKLGKINEVIEFLFHYDLGFSEKLIEEADISKDVKYEIMYMVSKLKYKHLKQRMSLLLDDAREVIEVV